MIGRPTIFRANIMMMMRSQLCLFATVLFVSSVAIADVKPADSRTPVFRIYVAISSPNQQRIIRGPQITFDSKRPLLVISSAREVRPTRDGGIVFVMTDRDARAFAAATRKYTNGLLVIEGQGSVLTVLHLTEPLDTGVLDFSGSGDAAVVRYLRQRFNLTTNR